MSSRLIIWEFKSGMCHNSIESKQISPKIENKAVIQKFKTITRYCRTVPVLHFPVLGF